MELLAFIDAAIAYEDPSPMPEMRSLHIPDLHLDNVARQSSLAIVIAVATVLVSASSSLALVQSGDQGSQVTTIQQALQEQGFDPGPIDGKFGPQTQSAVRQFQSQQGLVVDGIVGPNTEQALSLTTSNGNSPTNPTGNAGNYRVNTPSNIGLTIRSGPSSTSAALGGLPENALVQLTSEESSDGLYSWGRLAGRDGWVAKEFLVPVSVSSPSSTPTPQPTAPSSTSYRVSTPSDVGLIIRLEPSQSSQSLGTLAEGVMVQLTSETRPDGRYTWGKLANRDGWVAQEFLVEVATGNPGATDTPSDLSANPDRNNGGTYRVTSSGLNIRQNADLNSPILSSYPYGAEVGLTAEERQSDGYRWGRLADRNGWVAMDFLEPITSGGGGSSPPAASTPDSPVATDPEPTDTTDPSSAPIITADPEPETSPAPETNDGNSSIANAPAVNEQPDTGDTVDPDATAANGADTADAPETDSITPPPTSTDGETGNEGANEGAVAVEPSPAEPNNGNGSPVANSEDAGSSDNDAINANDDSLSIVQDVEFGLGRIAKVSIATLNIQSEPNSNSDRVTTVDQGTFVAYTRRVKLANDQEWYFLPAYGGWGMGNELELID